MQLTEKPTLEEFLQDTYTKKIVDRVLFQCFPSFYRQYHEDMAQAALMAIAKSYEDWDPERGKSFSFFYSWIKGAGFEWLAVNHFGTTRHHSYVMVKIKRAEEQLIMTQQTVTPERIADITGLTIYVVKKHLALIHSGVLMTRADYLLQDLYEQKEFFQEWQWIFSPIRLEKIKKLVLHQETCTKYEIIALTQILRDLDKVKKGTYKLGIYYKPVMITDTHGNSYKFRTIKNALEFLGIDPTEKHIYGYVHKAAKTGAPYMGYTWAYIDMKKELEKANYERSTDD